MYGSVRREPLYEIDLIMCHLHAVGEEESDNDSVDQMTKEQSDTDLAADCRKLNTPSPQIPVYSKEELMLALDRIDREINKGEQKLAKLKEGKVSQSLDIEGVG